MPSRTVDWNTAREGRRGERKHERAPFPSLSTLPIGVCRIILTGVQREYAPFRHSCGRGRGCRPGPDADQVTPSWTLRLEWSEAALAANVLQTDATEEATGAGIGKVTPSAAAIAGCKLQAQRASASVIHSVQASERTNGPSARRPP